MTTSSTDPRSATSAPRPACWPEPPLSLPRLRTALLAVVLALVPIAAPAPADAAERRLWVSPSSVGQPEVLRPFARPPAPWGAGHRGVDLAMDPAMIDSPVRAPEAGVISFAGTVVNRPVVSIRHDEGYISSFEPVRSDLKKGDPVNAGEVIGGLGAYARGQPAPTPSPGADPDDGDDAPGAVGDAAAADDPSAASPGRHHCEQPCLHWGVRLHGEYINPMLLISEVPHSVLLPVE